jgi:preprotein translocase subunit SecB
MDPTKTPGIRIDSILLEGISFGKASLDIDISKAYNVNIEIHNSVSIHPDKKRGVLVSEVEISEPSSNLFKFSMCYSLRGSVIEEEANLPLDDFLNVNAPTILFQFMRESLLTITQKAGMPIILPPVNLSKPKTPDTTTQPAVVANDISK